MRDWLATLGAQPPTCVNAETAQTAETPSGAPLKLVSAVPAVSALTQDTEEWVALSRRDAIAERSALVEFDGAAPRVLADVLARMEACPVWGEPRRWAVIVDALARMIDDGTAAQALAAGWQILELVGVQTTRPHGLLSRAGLVFSLREADRVTDVRPSHCMIVAGALRHTWLRCPLPADGSIVLPWELPS